jgi:hypothetical protein
MASKLGLDAKLYRNTGNYASPVWNEVPNVKDLSRDASKGRADVSTRGTGGYRAEKATLKELGMSFQMVYDPDDQDYTAFENAYYDNTSLEVASVDGNIATNGTRGIRFTADVFEFGQDENLEEAIMVNVELGPTYAANAPSRMTIP